MSTNQAFIDAYNATQNLESSSTPKEAPAAILGGSELVIAGSPKIDEARHSSQTIAKQQSASRRRPLSQVRSESLLELPRDQPKTITATPKWPEECQQLMAHSADKFDAVLRQLPTESPQMIIGVVGASSGTGCSTTAMCLALRSSALGCETLLADADLSRNGLAKLLCVDQFVSWVDQLIAGDAIEPALIRGDLSGVDLLLAGQIDGSDLEPSVRFRASLVAGALRRKYHRIVIDFGAIDKKEPCSIGELAAALGVDFLIATASPNTAEAELTAVVQSLDHHGLNLAGVIEAVA